MTSETKVEMEEEKPKKSIKIECRIKSNEKDIDYSQPFRDFNDIYSI